MIELTAKNVSKIFEETNVDVSNRKVNVLGRDLFFDILKLEKNKETIKELANQLPDSFMKSKGGGMSFLNACMDKTDCQWGEQTHVARLLALGMAIGYIEYCLPESMWKALPGGMPYFSVKN